MSGMFRWGDLQHGSDFLKLKVVTLTQIESPQYFRPLTPEWLIVVKEALQKVAD
jgi:hypothetical protein